MKEKSKILISWTFLLTVTTPIFAAQNKYNPPYDPNIFYMNEDLKELIDLVVEKKDHYNEQWEISLSQYKAWIVQIILMEVGNLRDGVPHSGGAVGRDTFYHITVGDKFPFSTGVGIFQLDRGGESGNENWSIMPTVEKLDPEKSLLSVLCWHKNRFNNSATLADFRAGTWSIWYGVRNELFEEHWKLTTEKSWDECKNKKIDVPFHPPVTNASSYKNTIKYIGEVYWNLPEWQNYFKTWLISAKTFQGRKVSSYNYYYAKDDDTGWEVWVWNSENLIHGYARHYATTYLPANVKKKYAGFSWQKPLLDPNNLKPVLVLSK